MLLKSPKLFIIILAFSFYNNLSYGARRYIKEKMLVTSTLEETILPSNLAIEINDNIITILDLNTSESCDCNILTPQNLTLHIQSESHLNLGLRYVSFAESEAYLGNIKSTLMVDGSRKTCSDSNCCTEITALVVPNTYMGNYHSCGVTYNLSIILESNFLTLMLIDLNHPECFIKFLYRRDDSS